MSSFKKSLFVMLLCCTIAAPLYAKPKTDMAAPEKRSAGDRITDHTADAVADVLTGEDSASKTKTKSKGNTPPGLAKKDKTPPGWDKGKKTGWDKEKGSGEKPDSPIKKFVKNLFGKE